MQVSADDEGRGVVVEEKSSAARMLTELVGENGVERTLQVGVGGLGAVAAAAASPNGFGTHIVVARGFEAAAARAQLAEAGLTHRVRLIDDAPEVALPALVADGVAVDLIVLDGTARFETLFIAFLYGDRLLTIGGTLVVGPADRPAVRSLMAFVAQARSYDEVDAEPLVVARKREARAPRDGAPVPRWSTRGPHDVASRDGFAAPDGSETHDRFVDAARYRELSERATALADALIDAERRAAEVLQLRVEAGDLEQALAELRAHHERAQRVLSDIKGSVSWRLTAPLRAAKALVRR